MTRAPFMPSSYAPVRSSHPLAFVSYLCYCNYMPTVAPVAPVAPATAFYVRHMNPCGHLRITSQRRRCQMSLNVSRMQREHRAMHHFSQNRSTAAIPGGSLPQCSPTPRCHVAVCLFGMVARYGGAPGRESHVDYDAWVVQHIAQPSLLRQVVQANAGACTHDVFLHTWETGARAELIERLYRPRRGEYGARAEDGGRTGMFLAIERVLALRRAEEAELSVRYDWVLCTRFDAVWMAPLPLRLLNPDLWYVANWCVADGLGGGSSPCRSLSLFAPDTHQRDGVPDYFFLASPQPMDAVFTGLTDSLLAGRLVPLGRSCCNHAILATRLKALGLWTRLGRVLTHHMDIETLRAPKFEVDGRFACWQELDRRQSRRRGGAAATDGGGCADADPSAAPHWLVGGRKAAPRPEPEVVAASFGKGRVSDPHISLDQPSPTSRCSAAHRYCLCRQESWSAYPILSAKFQTGRPEPSREREPSKLERKAKAL